MNYRRLSAIAFGVILLIELLTFLTIPTQTTYSKREAGSSSSLFGKKVIDTGAQSETNVKSLTIIGVTIAIGAIVTFSLPNKSKREDLTKNIKR